MPRLLGYTELLVIALLVLCLSQVVLAKQQANKARQFGGPGFGNGLEPGLGPQANPGLGLGFGYPTPGGAGPGPGQSCPLCDSSVYSYCSHKVLHDACCCDFPVHQLRPPQCVYYDCSLLYAKSCYEHALIKNCCCNNPY